MFYSDMTESGHFYDQQLIGPETANNCKITGDVLCEAPLVVGLWRRDRAVYLGWASAHPEIAGADGLHFHRPLGAEDRARDLPDLGAVLALAQRGGGGHRTDPAERPAGLAAASRGGQPAEQHRHIVPCAPS
jgi:hypothetical protein